MGRVALVCPYSWTYPGGVPSQVAGLARELRRRGVVVDVLAPADAEVDLDGFVPLGRTRPFTWHGTTAHLAVSPAAAMRTACRLRLGRYDIVHVHEPMLPAPGLTAVARSRAPVVATFHMTADTTLWYRVFRPIVRAAARRIAVSIAVSDVAAAFAKSALGGDYRIIPNAIDTEAFAPKRHEGVASRVVCVARAEGRKGLATLLRAVERLASVELDLVGVTESEIGRRARVRAHGRVSDEKLAELLIQADVLCAPSLGRESFGVVLLEAMAAGLPVVATEIPGYTAVLPLDAAVFVPPGDDLRLACALEQVLTDGAARARMGGNGRSRVQRFDWRQVGNEILAVYRELV